MRLHVDGTRRLLTAAAQAGARRVVLLSTSGTLAVSREPEPIPDERAPYTLELCAGWPYYLSKIYQEKLALELAPKLGLELVVLNPSLLLGPGDRRGSSTGDVRRFLCGEIPIIPSGGLSFVDARDVAATCLVAMEKGRPGARYLLGGPNWTFAEFLGRLERISKVDGPRLKVPARWNKLLARVSGVIEGVLSLIAFLALGTFIAWIPVGALAGILIVVGIRMTADETLKDGLSRADGVEIARRMAASGRPRLRAVASPRLSPSSTGLSIQPVRTATARLNAMRAQPDQPTMAVDPSMKACMAGSVWGDNWLSNDASAPRTTPTTTPASSRRRLSWTPCASARVIATAASAPAKAAPVSPSPCGPNPALSAPPPPVTPFPVSFSAIPALSTWRWEMSADVGTGAPSARKGRWPSRRLRFLKNKRPNH